jgi:hypothetical protein
MPQTTEPTLDDAIALREAGRLDESRSLLESLVAQRIRREGRKGYDSQCALSQLGRTLRAMGRAEEAGALHWEVLATRLELYGRRGAFTQNSARILADTLRDFLHEPQMAAAVERWSAEPEMPIHAIPGAAPVTAEELRQIIREHASATAAYISNLVDEYLQRPTSERLREPSQVAC